MWIVTEISFNNTYISPNGLCSYSFTTNTPKFLKRYPLSNGKINKYSSTQKGDIFP